MQKAVPLVEEITLALLKPDFIRRGGNESWIAKELSRHGLRIVAQKDLPNWSRRDVEKFYGDHQGKFFYQRLVFNMSSGPLSAVVLKGPNAIKKWREIIGPTHLMKAKLQPETLRAQYGVSDTKNSFHGSDSVDNAIDEIDVFFPGFKAHPKKFEDSVFDALTTPL